MVEDLVRQLGYPGLVLLMAVEHIFPPIPSEVVLPLAGFEVGRGNLAFVPALVFSTVGSLIGASVLYLAARWGGRPFVLRFHRLFRMDEQALDRAEARFGRHSAWIVVFGRVVPGLRSLVSVPPGLFRMPYWRYFALTLIGSLVWNAALIVAGQQLGSRWNTVGDYVGPVAQAVLIGLVPLTLGWLFWQYRRRRVAQ